MAGKAGSSIKVFQDNEICATRLGMGYCGSYNND